MEHDPPLGSAEFECLLRRLVEDIVDAAAFRDLHIELRASANDYRQELAQSWTFWSLTFHAHIEAVLSRLGRVYVSHDRALSLKRWLDAIGSNPQLFLTPPDPAQLAADIESASKKDPVVRKLIGLRHTIIAHINWENIAGGGAKIGDRFELTFDESIC